MKRIVILVLAVALTLTSCLPKGGDVARLIPQDAYAAVVAESPLDLFKSADSFYKAAALSDVEDGKSLMDILKDFSEKNDMFKEAVECFDFGRPFALAVVPDTSGKKPRAVVVFWLPMKDGQASYTRLLGSLEDFKGTSAFVKNYAAICLNGTAPTALPAKRADLSRLSAYPKDSLKAWLNMESLWKDFGDQWVNALEKATDEPSAVEEVAPGEPFDYNERNFDWDEYFEEQNPRRGLPGLSEEIPNPRELLGKIAENVRSLDFSVGVNEKGVHLRVGASVPEDRALGKFVSAAGPAKGLPYVKYLEADALMGGVSSLDPSALSQFMKLYLKAFNMEKYLGEAYFKLLESSYAAQGPDSAFSFDLSLAPDFMQNAQQARTPDQISDLIRKSISLDLSGTYALRDEDLYRETLKQLSDKDIFGAAFKELMDSAGMEMGIRVEEGETSGVPYDAVQITLGGPMISGSPEGKAALDALMEKLVMYSSCRDGKAYMVMGNPELLPEAIQRDGAAVPIAQDPKYKDFAATLPKGARGVYYVSLRKLYEIIAPFAPNFASVPAESLDKLYGYMAMSKGSMETGLFLGVGDIKSIIGLASELHL